MRIRSENFRDHRVLVACQSHVRLVFAFGVELVSNANDQDNHVGLLRGLNRFFDPWPCLAVACLLPHEVDLGIAIALVEFDEDWKFVTLFEPNESAPLSNGMPAPVVDHQLSID